MKSLLMMLTCLVGCTVWAESLGSGTSSPVTLNLTESAVAILDVGQERAVDCSPLLATSDSDEGLSSRVLVNGIEWKTSAVPTNYVWPAAESGVYVLTHEVRCGATLVGEPLAVTNVVVIGVPLVLNAVCRPLSELYPSTYACYKTIKVAEGVTEIVSNCFAGCLSLQNIDLSSTVTNIGENAFVGCSSIKTVAMGRALGGMTLAGLFSDAAGSIEKVTFRETVDQLPGNFFASCLGLQELVFFGDAPTVAASSFAPLSCSVSIYSDTKGWDADGDGLWKGLPIVWVSRTLLFAGAGDVGWSKQSAVSFSGSAWQSGVVTNRGTSTLTAQVFGAGTVGFSWKRQMESNGKLQFFVDGVQIGDDITENIDWTPKSVTVEGDVLHTLEWRYAAARSGVSENDACWVDEIRWQAAVETPCRVVYDVGTLGDRSGGGALDQCVAYGTRTAVPEVTAKTGWTFLGWDQALGFVTNDVVVTALYEPIAYAIDYNMGGVTCVNAENPTAYTVTNALTFVAPTDYDGNAWTFAGWTPSSIAMGSTGNKTIAAQWERTPHTIAVSGKPGTSAVNGRYGDKVLLENNYNVQLANTNIFCIGWTGSGCVPSEGSSNHVEVVLSGEGAIDWVCQTNVLFENTYNVTNGLTNVFCCGWIGTGCAPSVGYTNSVVVTLTGPCTVDWVYQTNVCLQASGTHGTVSPKDGWFDAALGESVELTFAADDGWQLYAWVVDGVEQQPVVSGTALELTMDKGHAVGVVTRRTLALAMDVVGGHASWQKIGDGVYQSGVITNNLQSDLAITVEGPASVSFEWKVSCENNFDYLYYYLDSETSAAKITGEKDWTTVSFNVGEGEHVIRWSFKKDEVDEDPVGEDCGWVRNITVDAADYRYAVRFEPGEHGSFSAGETQQTIAWGGSATAPTVAAASGWKFAGWSASYSNVTANVIAVALYATDFLPDIGKTPSATAVSNAVAEATDPQIATKIDPANYNDFRTWSGTVKNPDESLAGIQGVKASPTAWMSFALAQGTLLESKPTGDDLSIEVFTPAAEAGKFDFTVSVDGVEVGSEAAKENLKKVFGLEGAATLEDAAFSSDKVEIEFGAPVDGKVKFTAGPKDTSSGAFFMKVKMLP